MGGFHASCILTTVIGKRFTATRYTAWKVSVFGVILVRIFPHLDWIWRDTEVRMRENADQNNSEYEHFLRSNICTEADLVGTASAEKFMKVKQYNRGVLLLKVVYEALQQIKLEAFEEWLLSTHRSKSIEIPWVWRVGKSDWTTKPNEFQRRYWIGYSFVWKIPKIWRDTFRPRNYGKILEQLHRNGADSSRFHQINKKWWIVCTFTSIGENVEVVFCLRWNKLFPSFYLLLSHPAKVSFYPSRYLSWIFELPFWG